MRNILSLFILAIFSLGAMATEINLNSTGNYQYADAYYYEESGEYYWFFYFYEAYDSNIDDYTFPQIFIDLGDEATSRTSIVGTDLNIYDASYNISETDTVYIKEDSQYYMGEISITYKGNDIYNYKGQFIGEDNNTYTFDLDLETSAYDYDNGYALITLNDTPTALPITKDGAKATKVLRKGNVLIMNEGKTFTVQGQKVQ